MTIIAVLPLLVAVFGLVIYLFTMGLSKSSSAEVGRILLLAGTLAFLLGAGSQMQSCSVQGGGTSAQHR